MFFFKNRTGNEVGKLVPDLLLIFKKPLYEVEARGPQFRFNIFRYSSTCTYNKIKLDKTLDYSSRDTRRFNFLEKDLEIVYPLRFVHDFSRKMFVILLLSDLISLFDYLCFLKYWSICVLQLFVNQVVTL